MGAIFNCLVENPRTPVAYCSRPGLRLWISNKEGTVEKTLLFKDAVMCQQNYIQLLNPSRSGKRLSRGEPTFGPLFLFMEHYLVTFTPDCLLILDPHTISVVRALYDIERISSLCVSKNEIFILEGERHLIRLGLSPENVPEQAFPENSTKSIPIASQLLELTAKLKDSTVISAIPIKKFSPVFSPTKSSGSSDSEHVSECTEAQELPPVYPLDSLGFHTAETVPEITLMDGEKETDTGSQSSHKENTQIRGSLNPKLLEKINQEKYEEVVFQPKRKQKKSRMKKIVAGSGSGSDTTSIWSSTSETDDIWTNERLDLNSDLSTNSVGGVSKTPSRRPSAEESQSILTDSFPNKSASSVSLETENSSKPSMMLASSSQHLQRPSILPLHSSFNSELFSYDSIQQAVAAKEVLLSKTYNVESVLGFSFDLKSSDGKISNSEESGTQENMVSNYNHAEELASTLEDSSKVLGNVISGSGDDDMQQANSLDSTNTITNEENAQSVLDSLSFPNNILEYGQSEICEISSGLPSSDFKASIEGNTESQGTNISVQKIVMMGSGWLQFSAPQPISHITISSHYIAIIGPHNAVYYSKLDGLGLKWQHADFKADQISLSLTADHVWRTFENKAYALQNPSTSGPHGRDWIFAGDDIRNIAVGSSVVWVVSRRGEVFCHKNLSQENPVTSAVQLDKPCEWPVLKIACFSHIVWLLSTTGEVYTRVGVSSAKPEGVSWRRVNIPVPGSISDIALGAQRTGWIIDKNNVIMFSVDHSEPEPHWWQVLIADYIYQATSPLHQLRSKMTLKNLRSTLPSRHSQLSCVASSQNSIWIAQLASSIMHGNKTNITGHCWNRVRLKGPHANVRWQTVSAEGVFENCGQVWMLSVDDSLFCLSPCSDRSYNQDSLQEIPLPSKRGAVCLAAASQALWLLTSSGEIFIRQGLSDSCLQGSDWRELSLVQIDGVHLSHVSCGCDTVWACDTMGNMYMAISSPHAMATSTFSPAWIQVGDANKEQNKFFFIKVCVGSQTSMVWALDRKGKIYVREAIFPDFQLGLDWVEVSGVTALDLSTSNSSVWALSTDGTVYQRHGITQTNYIGDYWKKIPGCVEALSASICDSLWGINKSGHLLRHGSLTVHLSSDISPKYSNTVPVEDDDWEVIG